MAFLAYRWVAHPSLELSEGVLDFGRIKVGGIVTREVMITNRGKSDLVISEIKPECGCTSVSLDKSVLSAGESGALRVSVEGRSPDRDTESSVLVVSNDSQRPQLVIPVKFTTMDDYVVSPRKADFGRINQAELPMQKSVSVWGLAGDWDIIEVASGTELLPISATTQSSSNGLEISISLPENCPLGNLVSSCNLSSADGGVSVSIPVFATVVGDFYATPPDILCGVSEVDGAVSKQRIEIKSRNGNAFEIQQVLVPSSLEELIEVQHDGHTITAEIGPGSVLFSKLEDSILAKISAANGEQAVSVPVVVFGSE